jgi:hypothetical protein
MHRLADPQKAGKSSRLRIPTIAKAIT